MNIQSWRCDCADKQNSMGVKRCRKCGASQPSYTTDGDSIVVKRKSRETPAKPKQTGDTETFFQSTIVFMDDNKQKEK